MTCPVHVPGPGFEGVGATASPDERYRVADAIRREVRTQLGLKTGDYFSVHWESVADAAIAALDKAKCVVTDPSCTPVGATDDLRAEFLRLLTEDSVTQDRRRKDFNQAIFMENGLSIWSQTTLDMVMYAFDRAVKRVGK